MKAPNGAQLARHMMRRRLSPQEKQNRKTQAYAEKVFSRLMISFLEFIGNKDPQSKEVQDKIAELNQKWINHCDRTPEILPAGRLEFMNHVNKALVDIPAVMEIAKAEDSPEGTPEPEK